MDRSSVLFGASLATTIALFSFMISSSGIRDDVNFAGMSSDPWRMKAIATYGSSSYDHVWENGYVLAINGTQMRGIICNGFAGDIQYSDSFTIRSHDVGFTQALCNYTIGGPNIMEVEELFQAGLDHGMMLSESHDTLVLKDTQTNTTFVYVKPLRP